MARITCFPCHIISLWWWTGGAHRETAKLDTMMENKAQSFNAVVCKLWPLKMLGSSLHTEKQKGHTCLNVHPIHEAENKNYAVFGKSWHTYFCRLSCVFQFLSSQPCDKNQKEEETNQQNPHIPTPVQSQQRFKVPYRIGNTQQISNLRKSTHSEHLHWKKEMFSLIRKAFTD